MFQYCVFMHISLLLQPLLHDLDRRGGTGEGCEDDAAGLEMPMIMDVPPQRIPRLGHVAHKALIRHIAFGGGQTSLALHHQVEVEELLDNEEADVRYLLVKVQALEEKHAEHAFYFH
jgi:hypothetical protein